MMLKFTEKVENTELEQKSTLTLPFELRQKSRQKVILDNGQEAVIFLRRGTILKHNDLLASESSTVIRVIAAEESLSCAKCDDSLLFTRACYHLGNRHVPIQIENNRILFLHDHVLDDMLKGLGLTVNMIHESFEPEPGAYSENAGQTGHHYG